MPAWLNLHWGLSADDLPWGRLVHQTYSVPLRQSRRGSLKVQWRRCLLCFHRRKLLGLAPDIPHVTVGLQAVSRMPVAEDLVKNVLDQPDLGHTCGVR